MTEKEILELERTYSESKIQHTCVAWFRKTFPDVAGLLFAVPNGGWRGAKAGAMMQYEGQVSGVSDLVLLFPCGGKASLCVEMKIPKRKGSSAGQQSDRQRAWQQLVESHGSTYAVCHGIVEFAAAVCSYLKADPRPYIDKILNNYPIYRLHTMARQKTNYFPHDSNARNDDKIISLRMKYGMEGYGVYFAILERLRDEDDYRASTNYDAIAFDLRAPADIVRSVIEDFGLFVVEGNSFPDFINASPKLSILLG